MKVMQRLTVVLFILVSINVSAQVSTPAKMKTFVDGLMKKMTLEEKIGQLNLPGSGDIVTGQAGSSDIAKKIEQGKVGGLFNIKTVAKIKDVQKQAVEKSRLKMENYETINLFLDRDPAGISVTQKALGWDKKCTDQSIKYKNHKDWNDYLIDQSPRQKPGLGLRRYV